MGGHEVYPFHVVELPLVGVRSSAQVVDVLEAPFVFKAGASGDFDGRVACPAGTVSVEVLTCEGKSRTAKGTLACVVYSRNTNCVSRLRSRCPRAHTF